LNLRLEPPLLEVLPGFAFLEHAAGRAQQLLLPGIVKNGVEPLSPTEV
jgi:hypothetical protein